LVTAECLVENRESSLRKNVPGIHIFSYLDRARIVFLQEKSRDAALQILVEKTASEKILPCKEKFLKALLEREKLVSTGIGMGVAIPHAKLSELSDFFITIGIQKKRGLSWKSLDRSLIRLIFMIGGPDQKQSEYLQILSCLTAVIKKESIRKQMLQSNSQKEVLDLFQDF